MFIHHDYTPNDIAPGPTSFKLLAGRGTPADALFRAFGIPCAALEPITTGVTAHEAATMRMALGWPDPPSWITRG